MPTPTRPSWASSGWGSRRIGKKLMVSGRLGARFTGFLETNFPREGRAGGFLLRRGGFLPLPQQAPASSSAGSCLFLSGLLPLPQRAPASSSAGSLDGLIFGFGFLLLQRPSPRRSRFLERGERSRRLSPNLSREQPRRGKRRDMKEKKRKAAMWAREMRAPRMGKAARPRLR